MVWLQVLAGMLAPITYPGSEISSYRRLQAHGLAAYSYHPGWGQGWTVTDEGRKALANG